MRPDYSHKIFGDKRLCLFLRLEAYLCVRVRAPYAARALLTAAGRNPSFYSN